MNVRGACSFLLFLLAGACSQGAASPDAAPSSATCLAVRLCAFECADDACVAACRAKGSATALTAFDALQSCTRAACAAGDVNCACTEQCLADGACLEAVDACLGSTTATDTICDNICH
jgi:hypothetical protein